MATRNPNAHLRFSQTEPAFDGGQLHNDFVKAGLFVRQTQTQKLEIGREYRDLDGENGTLCMVIGGSGTTLYKLINNPETQYTQESDWKEITIGTEGPTTPIGEFDVITGEIVDEGFVLTDADAVGNNGEFYVVTNAPAGHTATYQSLFRGIQVTLYDGDYVLSVGDYWAVVRPNTTWDTLDVPQVILDYVNGQVISHSHSIAQVTNLDAILATKYDASNVADDLINYESNTPEELVTVGFMDAFYYRPFQPGLSKTESVYNASEVDSLMAGAGLFSPLTTKGDIWAYGSGDQRLPAGTDGFILYSDSAEPTGLRWGDATVAGNDFPTGITFVNDYLEIQISNQPNVGVSLDGRYSLLTHTHLIGDITDFTDNSANWDIAFGWGNHAGLYSPVGHTHTFGSLTSKPTTLAGYGITDAEAYLGVPAADGYILVSTVAGVRSWVAAPSPPDGNDYLDGASWNDLTGVITFSVGTKPDVTVDIDGRYSVIGHTHPIGDITGFTDNSTNWDAAYTHSVSPHAPVNADNTAANETSHADVLVDGDFASQGIMLRGLNPGDYSITANNSANWDTAYSHAQSPHAPVDADNTAANETSHADVVVDGDFISEGLMRRDAVSGNYSIVTDNSANWNTAFGWGDHAGLYAPVSHTHDWSDITTGKPTTLAGYGISDTGANFNAALSDETFLFVGNYGFGSTSLPNAPNNDWNDVVNMGVYQGHLATLNSVYGGFEGMIHIPAYSGTNAYQLSSGRQSNHTLNIRHQSNGVWGSWVGIHDYNTIPQTSIDSWDQQSQQLNFGAGTSPHNVYLRSFWTTSNVGLTDYPGAITAFLTGIAPLYSATDGNESGWLLSSGRSSTHRLYHKHVTNGTWYGWIQLWDENDFSSTDIANWNTAYSHSQDPHAPADADNTAANETSHADVLVDGDFGSEGLMRRGATSGTYSIVVDNSVNWNTAYGWGDHAGLYAPISVTQYTDEQAQDAVGAMVSAEFTYTDLTPLLAINSIAYSKITGGPPTDADNTAANETSHADVLIDTDFPSEGLMRRDALSATYSIVTDNSANWNTAFGWGNHAGLYDTTGTASGLISTHETTYNHANYDTAFGWGDHAGLYLPIGTQLPQTKAVVAGQLFNSYNAATGVFTTTAETDPIFLASPAAGITNANITNWNTAFGWGDHAGLYADISITQYTDELAQDAVGAMVSTEFTYTDATPLLAINSIAYSKITGGPPTNADNTALNETSHADVVIDGDFGSEGLMRRGATTGTYSIVIDNSANWNTAFGWGDHAGLYDTTGTASGLISTHETTYNHANYDTAFGWGDHAGLYLPIGTQLPQTKTVVAGQLFNSYNATTGIFTTTAETDPIFLASPAAGIVSGDITNWDAAFGWGDHAGLYDDYNHFKLHTNDTFRENIESADVLNIRAGTDILINHAAGGAVTINYNGSAGSSTFTGLNDTPSSYTGQVGKGLRVATGELALEFYTITDANDYVDGISFNNLNGVLTLTRGALADLTVDLDGRYLESFTETDPTVGAHIKAITSQQITNWDTAFGWGDHDGLYADISITQYTDELAQDAVGAMVSTEFTYTDLTPLLEINSIAYSKITGGPPTNADNTALNETSHADVVVDGDFPSEGLIRRGATTGTYSIVTDNSANWNTAYGWGDHAGLYAPISVTQYTDELAQDAVGAMISAEFTYTDLTPLLAINSIAYSKITGGPPANADNTAANETSHDDVLIDTDFASEGLMRRDALSATYSIVTDNSANWNTAFGWGDHAGLYAPISVTQYTDELAQDAVGAMVSTEFTYTDLTPLLEINSIAYAKISGGPPTNADNTALNETSHSDVVVDGDFASQGLMRRGATLGTYSIVTDNSANWNTAFGWGDHAGLYAPISVTQYTDEMAQDAVGAMVSAEFTYTDATPLLAINSIAYAKITGGPPTNADNTALNETSHADVVVDGDFGSEGLMRRGATSGSYSIVVDNSANWNTAFGWGDHAGLYAPISVTQYTDEMAQDAVGAMVSAEFTYTDATPLLAINSIAYSKITGGPPTNADNTAANETSHADVVVDTDFGSQGLMRRGATSGSYSIVTDNSANWNTAFGWGDHDGVYLPLTGGAITGNVTTTASIFSDSTIGFNNNNPVDAIIFLNETTADLELTNFYQGIVLRAGSAGSASEVFKAVQDGTITISGYGGTGKTGTAAKWLAVTSAGVLIQENAPASQVYPGAGIAVSTGSAWGTSITDNSTNWNTAFGWGDHDGLYAPISVTQYTDEMAQDAVGAMVSAEFTYTDATPLLAINSIAYAKISGGPPTNADNTALNETSHANVVVDEDFASQGLMRRNAGSGSYSIVTDNSANWNTAFGWGDWSGHDHAGVYEPVLGNPASDGYILSSTAAGVRSWIPSPADNNDFVTAASFNTGNGILTLTVSNQSDVTVDLDNRYLQTETSHSDVVVDGDFASQGLMRRGATLGSYSIVTDNSANWNTAFGWGNHAGLYADISIDGTIKGSTGSTDNVILRSNGTGGSTLQTSPLIVSDTGSIDIGIDAVTTSVARVLEAKGTEASISLNIRSKNSGVIYLQNTAGDVRIDALGSGNGLNLQGNIPSIYAVKTSGSSAFTINGAGGVSGAATGSDIRIVGGGGYVTTGANDGGNAHILGGTGYGGGSIGNVIIGTILNYTGGGHGVVHIEDAATNPSSNPTSGGILYSDSGDGSKLKWRVPGGTTYDLTSTGSSQVYPAAGIAVSTGSAWAASVTNNSANWDTAFGWGDHDGLYAPISVTGTIGGTIATGGHIAYSTAADEIGGEAEFTYTAATNTMVVQNIDMNGNLDVGDYTISDDAVDQWLLFEGDQSFKFAHKTASIGSVVFALESGSNKSIELIQQQTTGLDAWITVENLSTTADSFLGAESTGTGDAFTQYISYGQTKSFSAGLDGGTGSFKINYIAATSFATAARPSRGTAFLTMTSGGITSLSTAHTSGISADNDIVTKKYFSDNTSSSVTGTGTAGYVARWATSSTLASSILEVQGSATNNLLRINESSTAYSYLHINNTNGSGSGAYIDVFSANTAGDAWIRFKDASQSFAFGIDGSANTLELRYTADFTSTPSTGTSILSVSTGAVATFANFPVTPSSAPSADYQVANKKYVDDNGGNQIIGTDTNMTAGTAKYLASFTMTDGVMQSYTTDTMTAADVGAPTTTGSGASGTWSISITGSASFATSASSATTATTANALNVSTSTSAAWYDVLWISGTNVYRQSNVEIYPQSGYLRAVYFNATHSVGTRNSDTVFYSSTDDYIRKNDASGMRTSLNVPTRTGGNASGTWSISVTGSAGSASSATVASTVAISLNTTTTVYPTWVNSTAAGNRTLYVSTNGISFDPVNDKVFMKANDEQLTLQGTSNLSSAAVYMRYNDNNDTDIWYTGMGSASSSDFRIYNYSGSGISANFTIYTAATYALRLSTSQNLDVKNNITAYSSVLSDARLKKNVAYLDPAEAHAFILQTKGISYVRKYSEDRSIRFGYLAQEIQALVPGLVTERENPFMDDKIYLSMKYTETIPYITEAIKYQHTRIETAEEKIIRLEKRVTELEDKYENNGPTDNI